MKNTMWHWTLGAAFAGLLSVGSTVTGLAAEGRSPPPDRPDRPEPRPNQMAQHPDQLMRQIGGQMERLEQRLNQMAERQEQFMRRFGGQMERMGAPAPGGRENMRPPMPPLPEGIRRPMMPEGMSPAARQAKSVGNVVGLILIVWLICNILTAIWIFTDIRKRGEGPAIFVAMALVAGIPSAAIYALIRIGDRKAATT